MKSFVYAWQDIGTFPNKWYIGRKLGDYHKIDFANTYQSSCKTLAVEMKKRPNDFRRILLMGFEDKVSHIKLEAEMLQAVDAAHNPLYYNQHNENGKFISKGGWNGNKETGLKISASKKGKILLHLAGPKSEEHRRKISETRKRLGLSVGDKNVSKRPEVREKIRQVKLGKRLDPITRKYA